MDMCFRIRPSWGFSYGREMMIFISFVADILDKSVRDWLKINDVKKILIDDFFNYFFFCFDIFGLNILFWALCITYMFSFVIETIKYIPKDMI